MTHQSESRHPVDPTGRLTEGGIPEADLDRLIAATVPSPEERLRSALSDVDPAAVTVDDVAAMLSLIRAAIDTDSPYARAVRARDAARESDRR